MANRGYYTSHQGGMTTVDLSALAPLGQIFMEMVAEALVPKATRQQFQQRQALSELARLHPQISEWSPEDKRQAYSMFFPAYGVSHPPVLRKLFGAKAEPILPLPSGTTEETPMGATYSKFGETVKAKTPFRGRRAEVPPGINLPRITPHQFLVKPLLHPEEEEEIRSTGERLGWDEAEKQEIIKQKMSGKMAWPDQLRFDRLRIAEKMLEEMRAKNPEASDEELIENLPPGIRLNYKEHLETQRSKMELAASLKSQREETAADKKERTKLSKEVEKRRAAQQEWYQGFQERKLKSLELNKKVAASAKSAEQAHRDALTAYGRYLTDFRADERAHNQMEVAIARLDPSQPITRFATEPDRFEDWLKKDGLPFYQRMLELSGGKEGEGSPTPTPAPPAASTSPSRSLREKYLVTPPARR